MSRIQDILNKAERDGTVRRMRSMADGGNGTGGNGAAVAVENQPSPAAPPPPMMAPIPPALPVGATPSGIVPPPVFAQPVMTHTTSPVVQADATAVSDAAVGVGANGATVHHFAPTLVAALAPDAVTAEQYRALRTRVVHADNGAPVHMLLVTSPGRGEGKSVTAANLALTMAQEYQQRICLVDANLRHPQLHRLFDIPEGPGLGDVLMGRASLEDAIVGIEALHISVLPAGDPAAHPAELLGTVTMRRLLETLRSQFDRVVIDAPAAAPLADVGILTPLVDSVMLVVRAGITAKPAIQDALAVIEQGKLLGAVLNEAL